MEGRGAEAGDAGWGVFKPGCGDTYSVLSVCTYSAQTAQWQLWLDFSLPTSPFKSIAIILVIVFAGCAFAPLHFCYISFLNIN